MISDKIYLLGFRYPYEIIGWNDNAKQEIFKISLEGYVYSMKRIGESKCDFIVKNSASLSLLRINHLNHTDYTFTQLLECEDRWM